MGDGWSGGGRETENTPNPPIEPDEESRVAPREGTYLNGDASSSGVLSEDLEVVPSDAGNQTEMFHPLSSTLANTSDGKSLDGKNEKSTIDTRGGDQPSPTAEEMQTPPWLRPGCPVSVEPWRMVLALPWPAGALPEFSTVFSHQWARGDTREDNGIRRYGLTTMKATELALWPTEVPGGTWPSQQPGGLLRTILRLVAGKTPI